MNIKRIFATILFGLSTSVAWTQTAETTASEKPKEQKKIEYGLDGMLGVSIGEKTIGINAGGPSLKVRIKNFKIGVGAMPSLFIRDDRAVPRLAVGPIVEYGHWMAVVPYYGYDNHDKQIWTFGLGYKFF